ncbi:MAG: UDP-4-amino-4,6-dideoxy-N-acetyl-beta-L-altrosamine transaminase [Sporomusaceae bacterium]|nr:UDP-4-amino-4,6-dideoxy-N-acetyl-beta-L-altrosamine transaminase [Sporomusaceae bacterium]
MYIPYGRQSIVQADIEAVVNVLCSDWLTTGPAVTNFENSVAQYCGGRFATAVNSATSALHIAYLAAGLGAGDVLWTTPNTFVATANAALYCEATVEFVDVDPHTYNMSVDCLAVKLRRAATQGNLPKIVVPVHFSGQPCEMESIWALSQQYGFTVIEDASHAIGATYGNDKVGSCQYSHMVVFSFHPVKIITTGEGGMVVTNNAGLHERLNRLRSHGVVRDAGSMTGDSHGDWYYQQLELGFNYRMTDIQAALGHSQLNRIEAFLARRREIAERYTDELRDLPLVLPSQLPQGKSAWHLYVVCLDTTKTKKTRKQAFDCLRQKNIGVNVHYIPVHTQPYYQDRFGFRPGDFPNALLYYETCLSLPMYYGLSDQEQAYVIQTLQKIFV